MKKDCPRFNAILEDFLVNSPEMKEINEKYQKCYDYWSKESGENIVNIRDIDRFYATLLVEVKIPQTFTTCITCSFLESS